MQFCWFLTIANTILCLFLGSPASAAKGSPVIATPKIFQSTDGIKLVADLYVPHTNSPPPAVIVLHMLGHNRQSCKPLIHTLVAQGLAVLVPDLRGHGQSTERLNGAKISFKNFTESDWAKLPSDLSTLIAKMQSFHELDGTRIAIVGASIGANTAALAAQSDKRVKAIVLLSPGLDYRGLKPTEAMKRFHRPAYVIAGLDDGYSAKSSRQLVAAGGKEATLELLDMAGHGTDMFDSHPQLANKIALWLKNKVQLQGNPRPPKGGI